MPVTYTICMYDTVNALAPRGCYVACISAVWCNFHAGSGTRIAIRNHDNVYRYTKYLVLEAN